MPSAADRFDFQPPRQKASIGALLLALLIHGLLVLALTWGISWKHSDPTADFQAEIWSNVSERAAPRLVEPTPEAVTPPTPTPTPAPQPAPTPPEVKAPPPAPDVDIALEQEKKRKEAAKLAQLKEIEAKKLLDKQKAVELAKKQKEQKAKDDEAKRVAAADAKKLEDQKAAKQLQANNDKMQAMTIQQRKEAMNRMMGLAGASGGERDNGTALKSTGPSANYPGILNAAIRPNVVFSGQVEGNPTAVIEVRVMSDGTVISSRIFKKSGDAAWDAAALDAVVRTRKLPRDVTGKMPDLFFHIEMRPNT